MKNLIYRTCLTLFVCLVASTVLASGGHGKSKAKKVGILLVAFGSSEASAQISFENIDREVKKKYPKIPVRFPRRQRPARPASPDRWPPWRGTCSGPHPPTQQAATPLESLP